MITTNSFPAVETHGSRGSSDPRLASGAIIARSADPRVNMLPKSAVTAPIRVTGVEKGKDGTEVLIGMIDLPAAPPRHITVGTESTLHVTVIVPWMHHMMKESYFTSYFRPYINKVSRMLNDTMSGTVKLQLIRVSWTTPHQKFIFNRSRLFNSVVSQLKVRKERCDLFVFHDPCLMLESDTPSDFVRLYAMPNCSYGCVSTGFAVPTPACKDSIKRASSFVSGGAWDFGSADAGQVAAENRMRDFGGILTMTPNQFDTVNGFPSILCWADGRERCEMIRRIFAHKLFVPISPSIEAKMVNYRVVCVDGCAALDVDQIQLVAAQIFWDHMLKEECKCVKESGMRTMKKVSAPCQAPTSLTMTDGKVEESDVPEFSVQYGSLVKMEPSLLHSGVLRTKAADKAEPEAAMLGKRAIIFFPCTDQVLECPIRVSNAINEAKRALSDHH